MKHYTEIVPFELAVKLKDAGYEQKRYGSIYTEDGTHIGCAMPSPVRGIDYTAPTYAEVLDWLLEKNISVEVVSGFDWISFVGDEQVFYSPIWHESINAAIERALEIVAEQD